MKARNSFLLLSTASLFACSTLVGADFDDRTAISDETTGGNVATSGGAAAQGGQNAGGTQAKGGATQATGGSSTGGSSVGGSDTGGSVATSGGSAGQTNSGGTSAGTSATGGSSAGQGGIGPAGNGGQGAEGGLGGAGGEAQGGAGGEPDVGGAGGEAGGGTPPIPPVVVLNEVKAQGSGDDFVEIYNLGPGALALEGYGLSDQNNTFIFPASATIAEGGHVLLLLGQTVVTGNFNCFTPSPCYHATWGVSQNGENVYFRGRQNQVLDQTTYPSQSGAGALTNTQTWGRLPDGTGAFRATRSTPEATNQATP